MRKIRASSLGCEARKAWSTFDWEYIFDNREMAERGKPFHGYQKYIPDKYAKPFKHRTLILTPVSKIILQNNSKPTSQKSDIIL